MEQEILNRLEKQEQVLEEIRTSTEKTRKYLAWTFWITMLFFVIPLILIAVIIPKLLSSMSALYGL